MDKETTCCFTGYRPKDTWGYLQVNDYKYEQLQQYIYEQVLPQLYDRGYRTFLTDGTQGFGSCVFWAVEQFKFTHKDVENIVFCPYPFMEERWAYDGRFGQKRFKQQMNIADDIRNITETYLPTSINLCNQALINNSSTIIALFNETNEEKKSYLAQTLKMADKKDDYHMITIHYDDELNFTLNERLSKGLSEKRKVKLGNRNVIGIENTNPVPPLPENGFGDAICFDTETTGFSFEKFDELLQIAVVGSNGNEWMTYIKPDRNEIWKKAEEINHISPKIVKDAPSSFAVMSALYPYFKEAKVIVGHNVAFDINFITAAGLKITTDIRPMDGKLPEELSADSGYVWDTFEYFKYDVPKGKHKLINAVQYYCPEYVAEFENNAHDALADTRATMKVYEAQVIKEREKQRHLKEQSELDR